jgi:protein-tyrosine-phosphatase
MKAKLNPKLSEYVDSVRTAIEGIADTRKASLDKIAGYVSERLKDSGAAKLIFICTHNSRRSHISQIWAQTAAVFYGIHNFHAYSGGTEATAFNPRAIKALRSAGFEIEPLTENSNPEYEISYAEGADPIKAFSKKYSHQVNPQSGFGAVMTCSQADEACPLVIGAEFRQAIPYEDPKVADGTPEEEARYEERCRQIATEMFHMLSRVSVG